MIARPVIKIKGGGIFGEYSRLLSLTGVLCADIDILTYYTDN